MIIERLPEPIDVAIISDTFDDETLSKVFAETKSISRDDYGAGMWLNDIYEDPTSSEIHNACMSSFFSKEILESLVSINSMYGLYEYINNHSTIIRYYGQGQSSLMHYDAAAFTIMTFLYDEPKNFNGGSITIQIGSDTAYEQDVSNNMTLILPSSYYVAVSEVSIKDRNVDSSGLHIITNYLFIESR